MKLWILIASSLLPAAALAASPSDSWEQLRADRSVSMISQGSYAGAFGSDGFFNACVAGEELHSIRPLTVCLEGHWVHSGGGQEQGEGDSFVCTRQGSKDVTLSLNQVEQRCMKWEYHHHGQGDTDAICVRYESFPVRIPTVQTFGVYHEVHAGQEQGGSYAELLFNKSFAIPACN